MSCETFTENIDGFEVTYTQMSARESLKFKFNAVRVFGPSAKSLLDGAGESPSKQIDKFILAIEVVFEKNNPEDVIRMFETMFAHGFIDGSRISIDEHFHNKFGLMYKVLFWMAKCEYGSFLEEAQSLLGAEK